jgi:hypothetical protein
MEARVIELEREVERLKHQTEKLIAVIEAYGFTNAPGLSLKDIKGK